ncbi:lysylphosphatidylglycerol synthase transmembrane domain-containing protein [Thermostilla marina]
MNKAKKHIFTFLKIAVSVGLIGYLVWDAVQRGEGVFSDENGFSSQRFFAVLNHAATHWYWLVTALAAAFCAVMITFVRWWMLVRAIGIKFTFREALRLGFVGYLFNLAPMGLVGGDLVKAVLLARGQPGKRAEAVTSVFVDRVLGLYSLFLVATGAILLTGFLHEGNAQVRTICYGVFGVTAAATVGLLLAWLPDMTGGRSLKAIGRIPLVGGTLVRLVEAFRVYGKRPDIIFVSIAMTLAVHTLFATNIYFAAKGLFDHVHTWQRHMVMAPVSAAAQVLPVSIGPVEFMLDFIYRLVPLADGRAVPAGQGLVVVLTYRVISLCIATGGIGYYLAGRSEFVEVMHELEDEDPQADGAAAT